MTESSLKSIGIRTNINDNNDSKLNFFLQSAIDTDWFCELRKTVNAYQEIQERLEINDWNEYVC